jgi:cell fate (sporulation/competence/biofilm development) regulator YlbF (YheA/YmcA/DUF963 family)
MANVEDLISKARALGEALASHPTVTAYFAAQKAAQDDSAAQDVLEAYHSQLQQIRAAEAAGAPIEVADKQKLKQLESDMAGNDALKKLQRVQMDYVVLMRQVNEAIDAPLGPLRDTESDA